MQCSNCGLINNISKIKCVACFNVNKNKCWQCPQCNLLNNKQITKCIACFYSIQPSIKSESPITIPGRLHYQVTPNSQRLKQILLDGYIRNFSNEKNINIYIPSEIAKLYGLFYDEVLYWNIDCDDIDNKNEIYTEIFYLNDIKMKCSFQPNTTTSNTSIVYLHAYLPQDIRNISVYSELFCKQNNAHFRELIIFDKDDSDSICYKCGECGELICCDRCTHAFHLLCIGLSSVSDDKWFCSECIDASQDGLWMNDEYPMFLKCQQFKHINLAYYFEIMRIEYAEQADKKEYFKRIFMKKKLKFKWDFDENMIDEFRKSKSKQLFLSDTFDEDNSNWGLQILPMDFGVDDMDERKVILVLNLYKRPIYSAIHIAYTLTNDHNNICLQDVETFEEWTVDRYLKPLFKSKDLFHINSFGITIDIEIKMIDYQTDFSYQWLMD